jgi:sirohydrochlorin ferrochelatase
MTDQHDNETPTALLVMVHGSPRPVANEDMYAVVAMVREQGIFAAVEVGFMECNEPTIPAAIRRCVERGVQRVVAVPYFLHLGNHVTDDLPTLLEQAQRDYPVVEFVMGDWLGHDPAIEAIMWDRYGEVLSATM